MVGPLDIKSWELRNHQQ